MWSQIRNKHPVWYFDSSGSVMKDVDNKRIFIYSLVCYDEENQNVIPVSEFLTNDQTQSNIENFLFSIKNILKIHIKGANSFIWAPVIVTDGSWTLIGAIHSVYNNSTILQYLCWCFDILFDEDKSNKINSRLPTRTILCASHFLKTISKKVKQLTSDQNVKIKTAFLFAFSLLQNSSSIDEFKNYFLHIIYMFGEAKKTQQCIDSINFIKKAIATRNFTYVEKILSDDFKSSSFEVSISENIILLNNSNDAIKEVESSLKKKSPFTKYFNEWLIENNIFINTGLFENNKLENEELETNFYHNNQLITLIIDYLHIIPMWTGIILKKWHRMFPQFDLLTRITNNIVENWFGRLKTFILKNKRVMPSELVSHLYRRLLAKYLKSYFQFDFEIDKVEKAVIEKIEIWKQENNMKKIKGFYYSNMVDLNEDEKETNQNNQVTNTSLNQILDYC